MALTLTATQEAVVEIGYVDRLGNPAIVDGAAVWSVSNSEIIEVVPTDDPAVVIVRAKGALGTSQLSATADADLTDGVRDLVAVEDVTVVASEAVAASIVFGTPTEQPVAAPPVDPAPTV